MSVIDRRAAIISAAFILFVGMLLGYLVGNDFNFDRHSYTGGVSYVTARSQDDMFIDVGILAACTAHVEEGRSQAEGYTSDKDFLAGCQDAYDSLNTFDAIGSSGELFLPLTPPPGASVIIPVLCQPQEVIFHEWLIKAWCSAGK